MTPLFFVKFGQQKYLQELIDGKIYFSNAKKFRDIENIQQNKGQGDKIDGKFVIHVVQVEIRHPVTHVLIDVIKDIDVIIDFEQIETMPVFCITAINESDCEKIAPANSYKINFSSQKEKDIRNHFKDADSALIIKAPNIFIENVKNVFKGKCYADMVNYYDTSILTSDRITFLLGIPDLQKGTNPISYVTTDNAHKNLYCKDLFFKEQQEFRFVPSDIRISEPNKYDIDIHSEMMLIDIDTFFNGVEITI